MIVSDDTGYWDLGAYLGGAARGMDTPNLDRMAAEGMISRISMRSRLAHLVARQCKRGAIQTGPV